MTGILRERIKKCLLDLFLVSQKCRNARLTPFWVRVRLTVHIFWYALIKFLSLAVFKKIISGPEKVLKKSGISKSWICGSPDTHSNTHINSHILYKQTHPNRYNRSWITITEQQCTINNILNKCSYTRHTYIYLQKHI